MAMKTIYNGGGLNISAESMPAPVADGTPPAPVKANDPAKAFVKAPPPPVALGKQ